MNKIKNIIAAFLLFFFSIGIQSCGEEFLEVVPKDGVFESTVWSSYENANLFLYNIYNKLPSGHLFSVDPLDNWSDNSMTTFGWVASAGSIRRRDYSSSNSPVAGVWDNSYARIRQCNIVIESAAVAEGIADEEKALLIAQAKFLRAFFYFDLANHFGGVPIIEKPLDRASGDDLSFPRSTYDETIEFIRKDLTEAAADLPAQWGASDIGRATKGAALALRSEAELYSEKWSECVATCEEIMDLGIYDIVPDYRSVFMSSTEDNSEVIFDIEYDGDSRSHTAEVFLSPRIDPATGVAAGWGHLLPTQELVDAYEFKDGSPGDDPAHADDPYVGRDDRFYASILYNGAPWRGGQVWTQWDPTIQQGTFSNSFDENHSHQGTLTGYYFKKYLEEEDTPTETNYYGKNINKTNAILLRYAEVLLNFAEAKNELSGPSADIFDAVNRLRTRGGLPDLPSGLGKDELRERIRNERRVELAFEGKRYWDIVRWRIAEDVMNRHKGGMRIEEQPDGSLVYNRVNAFRGQMTFRPQDYLFPIPQSVMDKNPKLKQNPNF